MRILYWFLGGAAAIAASAYVAHQRSDKKTIRRFIDALESGDVVLTDERSHIPAAGTRLETYEGIANGRVFVFMAQTDKFSTRWTFVLRWLDEPVIQLCDLLKDELTENSLAVARFALKQLPVRREGAD